MKNAVHHIELWTRDLPGSAGSFDWLLSELGWQRESNPDWPEGRMWRHKCGVYVLLEQFPDARGEHDRRRAGLNHLAVRAHREQFDQLLARCGEHGWSEMFTERYPDAGGPQHAALFLENAEGFEVEIVAE